jgi:hypothetical protein
MDLKKLSFIKIIAVVSPGEDAILENWQVTLSYLPTTLQVSTENRHKTVHEELDTAKCVHNDYQDARLYSTKINISRSLLYILTGFKRKEMNYGYPR